MLSFSLGPLVVSLQHLLLFLALGAALLGGWLAARGGGRNAEPVLFNLLLLGLLVARLAFVVRYWPQYRGDFAQMLDIRDGGFLAWPGLLAAVLGALFWAWRRPALRRSLVSAPARAGVLAAWQPGPGHLRARYAPARTEPAQRRRRVGATGRFPGPPAGDQPLGQLVPAVSA